MNVLFIARSTLYRDAGGDTIQVLRTADYLRKLQVGVTVILTDEPIDYTGFDLLHFFNIIRPADILRHIRRSGKPFVVSTIYVDYTEYEKKMRGGLTGVLFRAFPPDLVEYAKVIARRLVNGEKIISPSYLWLGQKGSIRKIIKGAGMLLPNSHSEYRRLVNHYGVEQSYRAIPNAIDPALFTRIGDGRGQGVPADERNLSANERKAPADDQNHAADELNYAMDERRPPAKDPLVVICVGRIEGRKNQLNLIRALRDTPYKLILIGAPSANHQEYYQACREAAGPAVQFTGAIPQEELIRYYRQAKVHVLPSWFETTGLSTLEAAAMGCNIVITDKGDTREYFEEYGWYCDPASPASILEAVGKASAADFPRSLQTKIFAEYTWEQTAQKTLEAYQEMIHTGPGPATLKTL